MARGGAGMFLLTQLGEIWVILLQVGGSGTREGEDGGVAVPSQCPKEFPPFLCWICYFWGHPSFLFILLALLVILVRFVLIPPLGNSERRVGNPRGTNHSRNVFKLNSSRFPTQKSLLDFPANPEIFLSHLFFFF